MNTQQAAHYRALAAAHQDTPGDLAAAYREIGRLLEENEQPKNNDNVERLEQLFATAFNALYDIRANADRPETVRELVAGALSEFDLINKDAS